MDAGWATSTRRAIEKRLGRSFGRDISTPAARIAAHLHRHVVDHAFLRAAWANEAEFAPGLWRSNQPGPARLERLAARGFRTIVTLRGPSRYAAGLFEEEACARLGVQFHVRKLSAGKLKPAQNIIDVLDLLDTAPRPLLVHCKSGADRAGFAAALHLLDHGAPDAVAARQLHWSYLHFDTTRVGILDHVLRTYAAARAARGITLREWLATDYDPDRLTAEFRAARGPRR